MPPEDEKRKRLLRCLKTQKPIAEDDPECKTPQDYCKWRSACPARMIVAEKKSSQKRKGNYS